MLTILGQEAEQQLHPPHVALAALSPVSEHPHGALHAALQQLGGVQDGYLPIAMVSTHTKHKPGTMAPLPAAWHPWGMLPPAGS